MKIASALFLTLLLNGCSTASKPVSFATDQYHWRHLAQATSAPTLAASRTDAIPEIVHLKNGETVPHSLFGKFDSRKIARSLNYKIYQDREMAEAEKTGADAAYDYEGDSLIELAFPEKYLDSIAQNGFLNQHQLGHTQGVPCPSCRAEREDIMLGYKLEEIYMPGIDNPVNKVRPKYAFLILPGLPPESSLTEDLSSMYGNDFAVMKDDVKDRTTFTVGDSLAEAKTASDTHTLRFSSKTPLSNENNRYHTYVEAQIWGELTFADVEYVIVGCFSPSDPVFIAKLKALGKRVFSCRKTQGRTREDRVSVVKIEKDEEL